MQLSQSEEKADVPQAQLDRAAAREYACRTKVKDMNLGNHRSAYKTLGKLDGRYKESLQRMGYGRRLTCAHACKRSCEGLHSNCKGSHSIVLQ